LIYGVDSDPLWKELHELLKHRHMHADHDAIASVNRLLMKNERVKASLGLLHIPRESAKIAVESWDLVRLVSLLDQSQKTEIPPARLTGAVAVVRHGELEFLVDGRRRINAWSRSDATGPHRVLVVSEEAK